MVTELQPHRYKRMRNLGLRISGVYDKILVVVEPLTRVSAERKLVENVEKARAGFEEAIDDFLLTMTSLSRNGPNPEATRRLEIVTLRKDVTLQQLRLAVDRLNGFVLYGVVPEDLDLPRGA